jgi:alkylation response protein AidB-like acyl-CoA dehydrogenase
MDFALTADQEMIRDSAESFLAAASPSAAVRRAMATPAGYDPAVWQQVAGELGWCATTIAEAHGGLGLGLVEQALLMEQMGRRLLCAPYFSTAALAATALQEAGDAPAQARYLPEIAAGRLTATLAFATSGVEWTGEGPYGHARRDADGFVLQGRFRHVPDGATAGLLLLTAIVDDEPAPSLFALPEGLTGLERQPLETLDATRRLAEVRLEHARVPAGARIATAERTVPGLERTAALAAIALAAEQLGGAQQCLDLTLAYIGERKQFGRPIAAFQAVKHRCAELMVDIEAARSAVLGAACVAAAAPPTADLLLEAACAKTLASDTFFRAAQEAIQLHGGVGFTWEYDPHLYFKRAQASGHWLGSSARLRERVAARLLD